MTKDQYDGETTAFLTRYSAPEIVTRETRGSFASDIWSYGTLIYEVLTYGQRPFQQFKIASDVSEKFSCDFFIYIIESMTRLH